MYLKFAKVRDVKTPSRANYYDAGLDFFIPNDFEKRVLQHGEAVLIPSGIVLEIPIGRVLVFENKSGVAAKKNLDIMACVIDHGYEGEVHINLINNGLGEVELHPGDKIAQGILYHIDCPTIMEVKREDLYKEIHVVSGRGDGGFGSTGTK